MTSEVVSEARPIGMGCRRRSTSPDRDEDRAIGILHAALDAGATLLDTADAYCLDESDVRHNERLVARALQTWPGDRSRVIVATKGGLTRPGGHWVPDGRATHLMTACEASRRALGVPRIPLYQLHAPDPRTPLATSVRALAALKDAGAIERIGLCNVSRGQIEMAREITSIDTVQVELSVFRDREILSGVVRYCTDHGIQLIAHRPLGGVRKLRVLERDPVLIELANRHGVTPQDIALAWLLGLSTVVVPIPGPTRVETARRLRQAYQVQFTDDDWVQLDQRVPAGAKLRRSPAANARVEVSPTTGEIVLIMGLPAAGKSTLAQSFVQRGFIRLNRDEMGGSLASLASRLQAIVSSGNTQLEPFSLPPNANPASIAGRSEELRPQARNRTVRTALVADNTYATRQARAAMLDAARQLGLRVRGLWLTTGMEDAQTNAVSRMLSRYGRLLEPAE